MESKHRSKTKATLLERFVSVFGTVMLVMSLVPTQGMAEARDELLDALATAQESISRKVVVAAGDDAAQGGSDSQAADKVGTIEVTLQQEGGPGGAELTTRFVTVRDAQGRYLDNNGAWLSVEDTGVPNEAKFALSPNQAMEFANMPVGTYAVAEVKGDLEFDGYVLDESASVLEATNVQVVEDQPTSVQLRNVFTEVTAKDADATKEREKADSDQADAATNRNTQGSFTFEDDSIKVTAELQDPSALPAGVAFVVTPLTSKTDNYNYDAYMDALNGTVADKDTYSSKNTLLYDVAFLAADEDGKTVEVQPDEGTVQVKFEFKKDQLTNDIKAAEAADVAVTHLPLTTEAKDTAATTAEATGITAADVNVEAVQTVSATGDDTITMTVSDFSVYAFSYTVDFTHDGYTYSMVGESSILLGELLSKLGIVIDLGQVKGVEFSNPALVQVEQKGGDWQLTSQQPFKSAETLTVTLHSGEVYTIAVTDAQGGAQVEFYGTDGTTPDTNVSLNGAYYLAAMNGKNTNKDSIKGFGQIQPSNGVATPQFKDANNSIVVPEDTDSYILVKYTGTEELTMQRLKEKWYNDPDSKLTKPDDFGTYGYAVDSVVDGNGITHIKAAKKQVYTVTVSYMDDNGQPINQFDPAHPAVTDQSIVKVELRNGDTVVGYAISPVDLSSPTNTVTFEKFKDINDSNKNYTYAQALTQGYAVKSVRLAHNTTNDPIDVNVISLTGYENYINDGKLTEGKYDKYKVTSEEVQNGRAISLTKIKPTEYKVKVDYGSAITIPSGMDAYVWTTVTYSNATAYGIKKLGDTGTAETIDLHDMNWWLYKNGSWSRPRPDEVSIDGTENNVKTQLFVVPTGSTIENGQNVKIDNQSKQISTYVVPVGAYIQAHEVISYPSIDAGYEQRESGATAPRIVSEEDAKTVFTDVVRLKKCSDKFDGYSLEYILNGYNLVALCPNQQLDPSNSSVTADSFATGTAHDGDVLLQTHCMGGVLVRGDIILDGASGVADSEYITKPSVVGGYVPASKSPFINARQNNNNDWNAYIGTVNTVAGNYVNGVKAQGSPSTPRPDGSLRGYTGSAGYTVATDDYINWETLQSTVVSGSNDLATAPTVIPYVEGENTITVDAGARVIWNYPPNTVVTINVIGKDKSGNSTTDPNEMLPTVVTNNGTGNYLTPKLAVNGTLKSDFSEDGSGMSLVWNYPKATGIRVTTVVTPVFGHVLAPNAYINIEGGNYNGCMVGNKIRTKGEGHLYPYQGGKLIGDEFGISAYKYVDNQEPSDNQKFTFELKQFNESTGQWNTIETTLNERKDIRFSKIYYTANGTYYYMVSEDPNGNGEYTTDTSKYIVKVVVTSAQQGDDTVFTANHAYYKVTNESQLVQPNGSVYGINENGTMTFIGQAGTSSDGKINAPTDAKFGNTTTTQSLQGTVTLSVDKKVTGNTSDASYNAQEEFTFTLEKADAPNGEPRPTTDVLPNNTTVRVKAGNIGQFGAITYTDEGTYYYIITESQGNATGMTYDTAPRYAKVVVAPNNERTALVATSITYGNSPSDCNHAACIVTNKFSKTDYTPSVTKVVEGQNVPNETFNFTLGDHTDQQYASGQTLGTNTASVTGAGTASFGTITYTKPGVYVYKISENAPNPQTQGMTYSTSVVTITVTVTQDNDGALTKNVEVTGGDTDNHALKNTYATPSAEETLTGTKSINVVNGGSKSPANEQFSFSIAHKNDYGANVDETQMNAAPKNNASGAIDFGKIVFKVPGTYEYEVKETSNSGGGYTSDSTVYTVRYVVDNSYNVTKTITKPGNSTVGNITFTNDYSANEVTVNFSGKKTLKKLDDTEQNLTANQFGFTITPDSNNPTDGANSSLVNNPTNAENGTINFGSVTYTKTGQWRYQVTENAVSDSVAIARDTRTYNVTVTVTDNGSGSLVANVELNGVSVGDDATGLDFENTQFDSVSVAPKIKKQVVSSDSTEVPSDVSSKQFTFTLSKANAPDSSTRKPDSNVLPSSTKAFASSNNEATFGGITYTEPGTYYYTITENNDGVANVTYDTNSRYVKVVVTKNNDQKKLDTAIYYSADNQTYGTDTLTVQNTYTKPAPNSVTVTLDGKKYVNGDLSTNKTFEFSITSGSLNPSDGVEGSFNSPVQNNNDGTISFGSVTFTKEGNYAYTVRETSTNGNGITVDTNIYTVTYQVAPGENNTLVATRTITKNNDSNTAQTPGSLDFYNTYTAQPAKVILTAHKNLVGGTLKNGQFSFKLAGPNGYEDTKQNDNTPVQDGKYQSSIVFDELQFTAAGEYNYTITETSQNEPGIEVDSRSIPVTIKVQDDGSGQLKANVNGMPQNADGGGEAYVASINMDIEPAFTNTVLSGSAQLGVKKKVSGDSGWDPNEQFSFKISKDNENTSDVLPDAKTIYTTAGNSAKFDAITYKEAGTYYYKIQENGGMTTNMIYDTGVKWAKVVVERNTNPSPGESTLKVESIKYANTKEALNDASFARGELEVTNTYTTPGIEKYVNQDVHAELEAFDSEFTYDILAYVTADADKVVITDTLENGVKYKDEAGSVVITDLGTTNNHEANGTVTGDGTAVNAGVSISGKTLTATIDPAASLRGHWLRARFTAMLDNDVVKTWEQYEANKASLNSNGTVVSARYANGH